MTGRFAINFDRFGFAGSKLAFMAWNIQEDQSTLEGQRKLQPWGAVSLLVALMALTLAALHFLDGEPWEGARRLAFAIVFAVLGVKGSRLRTSDPLWVKLILGAVFLVYLLLSVRKFIVEP